MLALLCRPLWGLLRRLLGRLFRGLLFRPRFLLASRLLGACPLPMSSMIHLIEPFLSLLKSMFSLFNFLLARLHAVVATLHLFWQMLLRGLLSVQRSAAVLFLVSRPLRAWFLRRSLGRHAFFLLFLIIVRKKKISSHVRLKKKRLCLLVLLPRSIWPIVTFWHSLVLTRLELLLCCNAWQQARGQA